MIYKLQPGENTPLTLRASEKYSANTLDVAPCEQYVFSCDDKQRWTDLLFKRTPAGYDNALARIVGLRLPGSYCFCLCGILGKDESTDFAIGMKLQYTATGSGELSFFANDVSWMYWNNR